MSLEEEADVGRRDKPSLRSGPIIWSETRQELCESLPYYRSYHAGSYIAGTSGSSLASTRKRKAPGEEILKDSIPYGYLLAGWPSKRDVWAHYGRVIISHGGGKNETSASARGPGSGASFLKEDQSDDGATIHALLHAMMHRLPVILIAAESYVLLPFKMNCTYAVLGWYSITDSWTEKETHAQEGSISSFVRWKFRFEWIEAQGLPWWMLESKPEKADWNPRVAIERFSHQQRQRADLIKGKRRKKSNPAVAQTQGSAGDLCPPSEPARCHPRIVSKVTTAEPDRPWQFQAGYASCVACHALQSTVFSIGWFCLNPKCSRYFQLQDGSNPSDEQLDFSKDFLLPKGDSVNGGFFGCPPPFSLIPTPPSSKSLDQSCGLWCRECGRLSCREVIFEPRCAHCGFRVGKQKRLPRVPPPVLISSGFWQSMEQVDSLNTPVFSPSSGITMMLTRREGLMIYSFTFPPSMGDCKVHLVQADLEGGYTENVADQLFRRIQKRTWPKSKTKAARSFQTSREVGIAGICLYPAVSIIGKSDADVLEDEATEHESASLSRRASLASSLSSSRSASDSSSSRSTPFSTIHEGNAKLYQQASSDEPKIIPFRRHTLRSHGGGPGRMLTQQFTCNYGVPYKHVVAMGTEPLDRTSPKVIRSTLNFLKQRTESVIGDMSQDFGGGFNELYPVLYLEHQKMAFHDDGEPGLGPIVSSLSLGSTCDMKFRLKKKYESDFPDVNRKGLTVLKLPLRHGSVVIQQGHDLQKYFEHCVSPNGFRIAITARRIDADINSR